MKMYEYEVGEITEEGNASTIRITEKVENDLEQRNLPAHYDIAGIDL